MSREFSKNFVKYFILYKSTLSNKFSLDFFFLGILVII